MPKKMLTKVLIILFLFLLGGVVAEAHGNPKVIGAIIDGNTRVGREEKVSMEVAVAAYNSIARSKNKLILQVVDSDGDPLQASTAAKALIDENNVEAIIGMQTWLEAALVAEVANKAHVPVLSFAAPSVTLPLTSVRWPFLVKMDDTGFAQMKCIASIVSSYGWTRVIVISEEDNYITNSGTFKVLSDELGTAGSEIEHWLVFPPFKTISDPKAFVQEQLQTINSKQSRVFILVGSSFELALHVLTIANHDGLMRKDSVWIISDSFTNLLDSVVDSDISFMQGIIGIKGYFPEKSPSFNDFSVAFHILFRSVYPNEEIPKPGIYAARAYDAISTIALALDKPRNLNSNATRGKLLLDNILSSNFDGLSGSVHFEDGELSPSRTYEIVNIVGVNYSFLKYWTVENGFSDTVTRRGGDSDTNQVLGSQVHWPGNLKRVPLGWAMPREGVSIGVGIPGGNRNTLKEFVNVNNGQEPTGFSIDVFKNAVKLLDYDLQYEFVAKDCSYNDLVNFVYNKTFGAAVGDITILASRSNLVQFSQSYAESRLTMLVPVTAEDKAWLIVKPFSTTLWLVITGLFLYITFTILFLERKNPDFQGQWRNQICTAVWFTSSTIFFSHKENLRNSFTRVVMFVWLITVFVITSSYTASLASMLTVKRLEPTLHDIDSLRGSNAHVGITTASFVGKYLQDVFHFHPDNFIKFHTEYDYPEAFRNGTIKAAFTELPYARAFLARYPKDYIGIQLKNRFGGLGFVFPKGSPLARDISKAILRLSEDGTIDDIWERWFKTQSQSSYSEDNMANERLGLDHFWLLFLVTFVISTITVVIHAVQLLTETRNASIPSVGTTSNRSNIVQNIEVYLSSNVDYSSHIIERHSQSSPPAETGIASRYRGDSNNRLRALNVSYSFPAWGGRVNAF